MQYPAQLLPFSNYKYIDCSLTEFFLIRRTNAISEADLFEETTLQIKEEFIADQTSHLGDLSMSLLSIFTIHHYKLQFTKEGNDLYEQYCEPDTYVLMPILNEHFFWGNEKICWVVPISKIDEKVYPYDSVFGVQNITCKVCHTPTKANFWHFSIRWLNEDGGYLHDPELLKKKSIKNLLKNLKKIIIKPIAKSYSEECRKHLEESCFMKPFENYNVF